MLRSASRSRSVSHDTETWNSSKLPVQACADSLMLPVKATWLPSASVKMPFLTW